MKALESIKKASVDPKRTMNKGVYEKIMAAVKASPNCWRDNGGAGEKGTVYNASASCTRKSSGSWQTFPCRELPHNEENPLCVAIRTIQGWEIRISVLSSRLH